MYVVMLNIVIICIVHPHNGSNTLTLIQPVQDVMIIRNVSIQGQFRKSMKMTCGIRIAYGHGIEENQVPEVFIRTHQELNKFVELESSNLPQDNDLFFLPEQM